MNSEDSGEPVGSATETDAWLVGLLASDAQATDHSDDGTFTSVLMASLPQSRRVLDRGRLARLALTAVACSVAAMVAVGHGQILISSFDEAAVGLNAPLMISATAPFAVLTGLIFFAFRTQRGGY